MLWRYKHYPQLKGLSKLREYEQLDIFFEILGRLKSVPTKQINNVFWEALYKNCYMSQLLLVQVYSKSINLQEVIPTSLLDFLLYSMRCVRWKTYYIKHGNEILELLFLSIWFRNLNLFMKWMRKYFEKINLKKHRKLFLLLNFLLGKFIWNFNLFLNLSGVRVALRGKFAKAGSVRKIRKYIKHGKCSYTSKKLATVNNTNTIRTTTGVFSIKMELFF